MTASDATPLPSPATPATLVAPAGAERVPPAARPFGRTLQPLVHDLAVCVAAPTTALSARDGQLGHVGAQGLFHADVRVLSRVEVLVDGRVPETVADGAAGRGAHRFVGLLRHLGDEGPDPTVRLDRVRTVVPGGCDEVLRIVSTAERAVSARVDVLLGSDLAPVDEVKQGGARPLVGARVDGPQPSVRWSSDEVSVRVEPSAGPAPVVELTPDGARLSWQVALEPRGSVELGWRVAVTDDGAVVAAAPESPWWPEPVVHADDPRLATVLAQSLDDLHGLRMVTTDRPDDVFVAAGTPWYLTLFGRDSLWAARMTLPLGTRLAAGTLRTLAARQGTVSDATSQEQPGKILHELRRADVVLTAGHGVGAGVHLPARYYGTVDATPLWVCLLHDAWRWGMPREEVEPLLRNAERALDWVVGDGDPDGDGFLEYVDSGGGLANQGWKDSGDSVRFADGRQAEPPIALAEVQGYAYEAATRGSDLLEAFGRTGTGRYRRWAAAARERFADRFWVDGPAPYPAMALDGGKSRVDSLTSNVGHLLSTGLLSPEQTRSVVARLCDPAMDSGYGLRTMSRDSGGYSPLSYHCGSVWPHDTAIVVAAMARSGHGSSAAALVDGLLAAAAGFDGRVPELYGGDRRDALLRPVPYPAACRPQAWSAAAAVSVLEAVLGVRADVPAGRLHLDPMRPSPVGRLRVENLAVGSDRVSVEVDADGTVLDVSGTSLQVVTP